MLMIADYFLVEGIYENSHHDRIYCGHRSGGRHHHRIMVYVQGKMDHRKRNSLRAG